MCFYAIAELKMELTGPVEKSVFIRIGIPEPDPKRYFRCPFQIVGLSDDSIKYTYGVETFHALFATFARIRGIVKNDMKVLSAFHENVELLWKGVPWEQHFPLIVHTHNVEQLDRIEKFLEGRFWEDIKIVE